jgi:hypothetical protein
MIDNKELESGLKAMAEDFHLPGGGHKKLSQLVAGHMHWFDAAERRGMGWRDMIRALTAAGVSGRGGKPLSVGTLSSTVWRKRAETEDMISRGRRARLVLPKPIPESQPVRSRKANPTEQGARPNAAAGKSAAPPVPVPPPPKSDKSDRKPSASSSIREKLARVAKLRGG